MAEKIADPRTEEEVAFDYTDTAPGFSELIHRFGLIESDRELSSAEAILLAREAYWTGVEQMEEEPKAVIEHRNKFNYDLQKLRSEKT